MQPKGRVLCRIMGAEKDYARPSVICEAKYAIMSLFALGDLHLHFQTELKARLQKERAWKNHEEKFRKHCAERIGPDDTLVLVGDHSWGRNLAECEQDLAYIMDLPGKKVLLRGNHDMFWDAKKTQALNERFAGRLFF